MWENTAWGQKGWFAIHCYVTVDQGGKQAKAQWSRDHEPMLLPVLLFASAQLASFLQSKTTNPGMALLSHTPSLSLPHPWRPEEKAATYKPGRIFSRNSFSGHSDLILHNSAEQTLVTLATWSLAFGYSIPGQQTHKSNMLPFLLWNNVQTKCAKDSNTILIYNRSLEEVVK